MFVSLDGIDGTGKSTQCRLLADWLREQGRRVVACADPGGTPLGDQLRGIVLGKHFDMSPACEAFLFMASRAELVAQVIRPAIESGACVVCDRFVLANIVYQGHAGGLNIEQLRQMGSIAAGGLTPDVTLVLDLPVEMALKRRGRIADRMESRGGDYHERVRRGFLAEAKRNPSTMRVIDAAGPVDEIQASIRAAVQPLIDISRQP